MPRNPLVPGVIKIELLWAQAGIPAANVLHASYTGGTPSGDDCANLAQGVAEAFWIEGLYEGFPTSTVLVGAKGTDLATDTGADGEWSSGQAGTYAGGELPASAALLVNFSIARRYRGGHPRMYVPPANQTLLSSPSSWGGTILTELGSCVTLMLDAMAAVASDAISLTGPVCVSYRDADAWRVDNLVEPITGFNIPATLGTQRRRIRASSY